MAVMYKCDVRNPEEWRVLLAAAIPDLDFRVWPDVGNPEEITAALVWEPVPGDLARYPNLGVILSVAAGVDNILSDPDLPDVPVCRIVDEYTGMFMAEYAAYYALRFHRHMYLYDENRRQKLWRKGPRTETQDRHVGVLGLGNVGRAVAAKLAGLGFPVTGWSRSPTVIDGIATASGTDGFAEVVAQSAILVNALPLTDETRHILNAATFARMPKGSFVINMGRGEHLVPADLMASLDSGQVERAALDVFEHEPLPQDDPLWSHPGIEVTPHIAAATNLRTASRQVIENLRRLETGEPFINAVDRARGY
jgi:glyoxylate/hydroxypyruvate reductase A